MTTERINFLLNANPEWGMRVVKFLEKHKEFSRFAPIAPLKVGPNPYTKNAFGGLLYGIASAGVRGPYGFNQFELVRDNIFNSASNMLDCEKLFIEHKIQPKKIPIYRELISRFLINIDKYPVPVRLTPRELKELCVGIKGIGETTWMLVYEYASDEEASQFIPFADRGVVDGFKKVYPNVPKSKIRETIAGLSDIIVANRFFYQIYHYSDRI